MKNIALIKSIVATSISSANPAELTEHIATLIQAHPEETRENALAILTGTADRRNGLLLCQLHSNRNSLVKDRGRRQCWKERQLQP